ncbi:MAG: DEAD/DEAH box helicase family protein [Firmicutes bacterium]|nr:DEAD/DEAH box helicase family protein [Bacillota bacterium]
MKDYSKMNFKGLFRNYQQRVLDHYQDYLDDGRIHIVASPGSGKTTLGIELIRLLNQPSLVLSPSITIRNQWVKRIKDGFLSEEEKIQDYTSYSLKEPKLVTSVTYQGLHAAYNQLIDKDESEDPLVDELVEIDYTNFDLVKAIKKSGIKTICLDEAHHLRTEWHKSLVSFINLFEHDFTIIALTATPPYDSSPFEWDKYIELCGEIDEEIFVPELVSEHNLCPHQDYIYFNYPTEDEKKELLEYRRIGLEVIDEIFNHRYLRDFASSFMEDYDNPKYLLYDHIDEYITMCRILEANNVSIPKRLKRLFGKEHFNKKFKNVTIECLFDEIISSPEVFTESLSEYVKETLKRNGLLERGKAQLQYNSKLKKNIVTSIGKIKSIGEIAKFESTRLGHDLQMLVLTDFIKQEMLDLIGSEKPVQVIGAVPIFEVIRRNVAPDINIAILTGSLVIIPNSVLPILQKNTELNDFKYTKTPLNQTDYSIISFRGNTKESVHAITELFENRDIDILIGTKSLLGEGWDSQCINTLILASFVGSYMLSNQMRGRAIRVDRRDPDKVSSIWHLATIEPYQVITDNLIKYNRLEAQYQNQNIVSHDFDMLKRRFQAFLGPRYSDGEIQNGIERLDTIKPPFGENEFEEFNRLTFELASDRELVRLQWDNATENQQYSQIVDVGQIPNEKWQSGLLIFDSLEYLLYTSVLSVFGQSLLRSGELDFFKMILFIAIIFAFLYVSFQFLPKIITNITPLKTIRSISKAILDTLLDLRLVKSSGAKVEVKKDIKTMLIHTSLLNGTRHEKTLFTKCIVEMLSPIDNPRYLIVQKRKFFTKEILVFSNAYSVPSAISSNMDCANAFSANLNQRTGNFKVIYTRSEEGRKTLLKAKKKSNLSRYQMFVQTVKTLRK